MSTKWIKERKIICTCGRVIVKTIGYGREVKKMHPVQLVLIRVQSNPLVQEAYKHI